MIRILLVDDQNIVRQGIQALLEPRQNLQVVGVAKDANSAMEQIQTLMPDIVLMDIEMPGMSGIMATQQICQQFPTIKVLVLSSHEDKKSVIKALQAGAQGYLLKSTLLEELEQAICSVNRGCSQIESKLLSKIVTDLSFSDSAVSLEQEKLVPVVTKISKLESDNYRREKIIAKTSVEESNFNNQDARKTTKNIQNRLNKSVSQRKGHVHLKPSRLEAEKKHPEKSRQIGKRSLIGSGNWLKNRLLSVSILSIMLILFLYYFRSQSTSTPAPAKTKNVNILPVKTTKIEQVKSYQTSQIYTGEVAASRTTSVSFERGGKLVEIFVNEGDFVPIDTPIAQLDSANLIAQRQGLLAQKEQEEALLAELRNGASTEQIRAAQATVGDLEQQLELEKIRSSRRESLYEQGAISREQLDEIAFNRNALEKRLANAQSGLNELQNGTRVEQINAQQAAVNRLIAQIKNSDITIERSILRSPFDGVVSIRHLDEGTVVEAGAPIIRLVDNAKAKVKIGIPIDIAGQMEPGSRQKVSIGGKDYSAVVDSVLPEVNTETRTRTLVLKLAATVPAQVSPQQIARLKVTQTNSTDGYWLPITALIKGDRGLWSCYALTDSSDGNYQIERRDVEILETQENLVLARGTLQPGDEIIINGTHRLVPGQLVTKE